MLTCSGLTTAKVLAVFCEEVISLGGRVTDSFDDGRRLFTRSVLPHIEQVRRSDSVQGGVALKAVGGEICLYPYVFRLVCLNGAILAETVGSLSIVDLHFQQPDTVLQSVREGVGICCEEEVFASNVRKMRTGCDIQVDLALAMLPLFSRFPAGSRTGQVSQIMDRFLQDGDSTRFGLANAVTAIARDSRDPQLKWDLEELGGAIAIGMAPTHPKSGGRMAVVRSKKAVTVS